MEINGKGGIDMSKILMINNSIYADYGKIASGKAIQSAVDGAAELGIIQKQQMQVNTYDTGADNIKAASGLANITDSALSGISDYLGRIHELSIRSMNGTMSDSDKAGIQAEIDQMLQGIEQFAGTAMYNETYLLNGTSGDINVASGSGNMSVSTGNMTLKALGLDGYNIMGDFNLEDVENAMDKVSKLRSKVGAQTNALEYAYNYTTSASLNTTASQSRLEDLDYPKAISEQKKKEVLQEYALTMQKKFMENEVNLAQRLFL